MHNHGVRQDTHQCHIIELENKPHLSIYYIDQLENRHHQSNLRLLNVPESAESNVGILAFLIKLLDQEWNIKLKVEDVETLLPMSTCTPLQ